jgi:hypothetical protein
MSEDEFDQDGWLARVGYHGSREPTLETLKALVSVHSSAIAYESIDVLLDRPPKLDLRSLPPRLHRRPRCPRQEPRTQYTASESRQTAARQLIMPARPRRLATPADITLFTSLVLRSEMPRVPMCPGAGIVTIGLFSGKWLRH